MGDQGRVLVVDDDEAKRYVVTRTLRDAGFTVEEAATGCDTIAKVAQFDPELVVLDVRLPDIDGMEVARRIKAEHRGVLVLQLSATFRDSASRTQGLNAGADTFLTHPVEKDELLATVRALLRIGRTERALMEANARLERWAEFQQIMLGVVGHDLRNPLTAIITTAATSLRKETNEAHKRAFTRITTSAHRATRIVNGLLDYSRARLGAGIPIERTPVDLVKLLRGIVDEVHAGSPDKTVALRIDGGDISGSWDPDRLDQVFMNLIQNAVQYAEPGSVVRVLARTDGADAVVSVHNRGQPIPEELLPTVFEPFKRGSVQGPGLGLGLYIVKQIVLAHGGDVTPESSSERGTTLTVRLPKNA